MCRECRQRLLNTLLGANIAKHSAEYRKLAVVCARHKKSAPHPAKFGEVISPVTGAKVPLPPRLAELVKRPRVSEPMAVDLGALEEYVAGV